MFKFFILSILMSFAATNVFAVSNKYEEAFKKSESYARMMTQKRSNIRYVYPSISDVTWTVNHQFPNTLVGQSEIVGFWFGSVNRPNDFGIKISIASMSGAPDFSVINDTCNGVIRYPSCYIYVAFHPSSPGTKAGQYRCRWTSC